MPNKRDILLFYTLSFTWGIVYTIVGLFVLLYFVLFKYDKISILIIAGRICIRTDGKYWGGISLGIVYIVDARNSYRLHVHELGHTVQHIMFGPLFIPLVAIPSVIRANLRKKYRKFLYDKNGKYIEYDSVWFEGQATRLGEKYFSETVIKFIGSD